MFDPTLLSEVRERFHHVAHCPYQGARIFFENAGGSLTLKSVVEVSARLSAIPDNQGRDNPASAEMVRLIQRGREDMMTFLGASEGRVFVGETGTECLFRVIRAAVLGGGGCLGKPSGTPGIPDTPGTLGTLGTQRGQVLGSTLEHPATASAARHWAALAGMQYIAIAHHPHTGSVDLDAYRRHLNADLRVATIIQTSPVTGISVDVCAISNAIREAAPDCYIIVDGIQHAPHAEVNLADYPIDAYAVSGYKVFSRHNYGFAWVSPRLAAAPHDRLEGTAEDVWELGTRDAAAYATFSEVVDYLGWLGSRFTDSKDRRARLGAAGKAIVQHEKHLIEVMLHGAGQQKGLAAMREVFIIGGAGNHHREGLVSLAVKNVPSAQVVRALSERGVRVHIRKNDHFSANILTPLNMESCVRVSMCHYNSADEVAHFLAAMEAIVVGG